MQQGEVRQAHHLETKISSTDGASPRMRREMEVSRRAMEQPVIGEWQLERNDDGDRDAVPRAQRRMEPDSWDTNTERQTKELM